MAITRTYAVGENGRVFRKDNQVGSWIDVSPPFLLDPWAIYDVMSDPLDSDKVTVVGQNTIGGYGVAVSINAGASWIIPGGNWQTKFDDPKPFYEVWYVNSDVIWAVGEKGRVIKSIDGGLTFNATNAIPNGNSAPSTRAIHAIESLDLAGNTVYDQVAIVLQARGDSQNNSYVYVWKTIDGGFSWTKLNQIGNLLNNNSLQTITGISPPRIGFNEGVWISDDQNNIIATTSGTQNVSFDGGDIFTSIAPQMDGAGRHLTWYPSYGDPGFFRHFGGPDLHLMESIDIGATWINRRPAGSIVINGAHFYSEYNGYYLVQGNIYITTDGGVTGDLDYNQAYDLHAVWTVDAPVLYQLEDCLGNLATWYSSSGLLEPLVGMVVQVSVPFGGIGHGGINIDPDACWTVSIYDPTAKTIEIFVSTGSTTSPVDTFISAINSSHDDCVDCLPEPADDTCWDLISCNGECPDILGTSSLNFTWGESPIVPGMLVSNTSTGCVYEIYPIRQATFISLQTGNLSPLSSAFRAGDNIILECPSFIYNGVEQVTTPFSYQLTAANYQPSECVGLTCTPIMPSINWDTTENAVDNVSIFFNDMLTTLGLPIESYSDDPQHCGFGCGGPDKTATKVECKEMFRLQYREGDTFTITVLITQNGVTIEQTLQVYAYNLSLQTNLLTGIAQETCNSDVYCPPVVQPTVTLSLWDGDCPTPIVPPVPLPIEMGEPCDIVPRLGEPGFSTKNCSPEKIIDIKCKYGDAVYAWFKRTRYGIETCCEFDLDKIDVKNQLVDHGFMYDPDLCTPCDPVPIGCCIAPCDAVAMVCIPAGTCPAPTNVLVVLTDPSCVAPTTPVAVLLVLPGSNCEVITFSVAVGKIYGSVSGTLCNGDPFSYALDGGFGPITSPPVCVDLDQPIVYTGFPVTATLSGTCA